MKILNLKFNNINSMAGENRIDFDQPPLGDAGVFAITGPNGSGKSSILDAITLALYGETYRFDRPADQVMTKFTAECYSEVEFSLGEDIYRSSWRVNRENDAVDGECLTPEMMLWQLNDSEELLAEQPYRVLPMISKITGMDFRRFSQSIVLAQGEFAAFLNAEDSERLDILEKIISTDVYSDYKQQIIENAELAKDNLAQIHSHLASISLLNTTELETCEDDLADFKQQVVDYRDEKKNLQEQRILVEKQQDLKANILDLQHLEQQASSGAAKLQSDLEKVNASANVLEIKDDIEAIDKKTQQGKQLTQSLADYRTELRHLQDKLKELGIDSQKPLPNNENSVDKQLQIIEQLNKQITQLNIGQQSEAGLIQSFEQQISEKQALQENVISWLSGHKAVQTLAEKFPELGQLQKLRTELLTLKEKQASFTQWRSSTQSSLKKNSTVIEKINNEVKKETQKLKTLETELEIILQGNTLEHIKGLYTDQVERLRDYQKLNDLANQYKKNSKQKFSWFSSASAEDNEIDEFREEYKEKNELIAKELKIRAEMEKSVAHQTLLKSMEQYRGFLLDGEPCPLCGAEQHPYSEHIPPTKDYKKELSEQRIKLKVLQKEALEIKKKISVFENKENKEKNKQKNSITIRSQWLTLCTRLNQVSDNLEISNIKQMRRLLDTEQAELKEITALLSQCNSNQNSQQKITQQLKIAKDSLQKLQASNQQLESDWNNRPQELIDIDAAFEHGEQEVKVLADDLINQLSGLGEALPEPGEEDVLADKLKQRLEDYQSYEQQHSDLQAGLDSLALRKSESETKISQNKQLLLDCSNQLHAEEGTGLHLALIAKQKLIVDQEQAILQAQQDVELLQNGVKKRLQNTQSLDEAREILALVSTRDDMENQLTKLQAEIETLAIEKEKFQSQLEAERDIAKVDLSAEAIDIKIREISTKMDIATQEANHQQEKFQQNQVCQQQHEELQLQLATQEKSNQECTSALQQIADENGMAFRRRVQSKMADQLLQHSNQVLEKISGRYYVHQCDCEHGLALEIEDTKQENIRRLPQTLSGGESFVVSLALALSLSELANNGKAVDSLFIDEGFGTLDPNTLSAVINTLEELQSQGKSVGVISHVEAVRKRFKTQIAVIKKPNGLSELKLPKPGGIRFQRLRRA